MHHPGVLNRNRPRATKPARPASDDRLPALNEARERFAAREPQKAELVKLRYFVGLKIEEAADVPGISQAIAKR
jgi:DNA-directed RNA polymerase specialized sigma24 family protein